MTYKVSYTIDGSPITHTWRGKFNKYQVLAEKKEFLRDIHGFHQFITNEDCLTGIITFRATRFYRPEHPRRQAKHITFTLTPCE